jgi:hypothetical protein
MAKLTNRINQIYQKVNSIARKGKDGYLDYSVYLDELVNQGEWILSEDMMNKKYLLDIRQYKSVEEVKNKTFEKVRFFTLDEFQQELKDLYLKEGVYQNAFTIYRNSDNLALGQIYEIEILKENQPMYQDFDLAVKEKVIVINLEVHKEQDGSITLIDTDDLLIDKYEAALVILTSI